MSGLTHAATLALWQQWHRQGSMQLGRVERVLSSGGRQTQALGITVWLTDAALDALASRSSTPCSQRVYEAAAQGLSWVMTTPEISEAHDRKALNLMVLHFWSQGDVNSPDFQPVFLQAHMLFRDLHQGFGVQSLVQEVTLMEKPFLQAAGMETIHSGPGDAPDTPVWMGINRAEAHAKPGSTFSFLFFSPPRRLALPPAVQRMLALATRQMTDDDIATNLGCSRDYVRKLWTRAYASMEESGVLAANGQQLATNAGLVRGRERRRTALEFLRANPHEIRPGLIAGTRRAQQPSTRHASEAATVIPAG